MVSFNLECTAIQLQRRHTEQWQGHNWCIVQIHGQQRIAMKCQVIYYAANWKVYTPHLLGILVHITC